MLNTSPAHAKIQPWKPLVMCSKGLLTLSLSLLHDETSPTSRTAYLVYLGPCASCPETSIMPRLTLVALQNSLATLPMLLLMLLNSESKVLLDATLPNAGIVALVLSCVGGLGMSYFSFALRAVISATSFSVIGNICKVLTILVNILMWDQHASKPSRLLPVAWHYIRQY